jgi:hypothetical protein
MRGRYDQQSEHLEAVGSKEAYVDLGHGFCAAMLPADTPAGAGGGGYAALVAVCGCDLPAGDGSNRRGKFADREGSQCVARGWFSAWGVLEKILITFLDDVDLDVHHSIHLRRSK